MAARNIKVESKSFSRYLNKRVNKVYVGPIESESGELIMERKEMADEFNRHSVFTIV